MTNNDSLAVKVPYNKAKIASLIENEFNFDLEKYDAKPYLKNSMLSTPLSYMGYAGYLNPFTLETQINQKFQNLIIYFGLTKWHINWELLQKVRLILLPFTPA